LFAKFWRQIENIRETQFSPSFHKAQRIVVGQRPPHDRLARNGHERRKRNNTRNKTLGADSVSSSLTEPFTPYLAYTQYPTTAFPKHPTNTHTNHHEHRQEL
jgi:hypothetical protein